MDPKQEMMTRNDATGSAPAHESQGAPARLAGKSFGASVFSSPFGPRIMLEAPTEGGTPPAATPPAAEPPLNNAAPPAGNDPPPAEKPVRPDYIPENFWDAEKGFKGEDFNALVAFKAEHDSNLAQVPATKDDYKVSLPKDFKLPEGFELPEGQTAVIDENDPRIGDLRAFAHSKNMSQSDFEDMVALGAQLDIAEQGRLKEALTKQRDLLGGKAAERINSVTQWLGAKLGGEAASALAPMMYTAKQVEAFEALMRLNRGAVPGNPGGGRDGVGGTAQIDGYENMTFRQRMAAIDALNSGKN